MMAKRKSVEEREVLGPFHLHLEADRAAQAARKEGLAVTVYRDRLYWVAVEKGPEKEATE